MMRVGGRALGAAATVVLGLSACTANPVVSPSTAVASLERPTLPTSLSPSPSSSLIPTTSPVQGLPALSAVDAVDSAGSFGRSGLWAIRGSSLFVSTDSGSTWRRTTIPTWQPFLGPSSDFMLDASRAWAITFGPGTSGDAGGPVTRYVVSRTSDGGRTWRAANVPGNYPGTSASIEFIDSQHGFFLAAADRLSLGTSVLLRTADAGATWTVAGHGSWLGSLLTVSDPSTIWAGGQQQAGGMFAQPVLAVSRDAGRTWSSVSLAGIAGTTEADCGCYLAQPPLFLDSRTGYVVVVSSYTQIYRTTNGGQRWSIIAVRPNVEATGLAVLDPTHLLLPTANPSEIDVTADGGANWATASSGGSWSQTNVSWVASLTASEVAALAWVPGPDSRLLALLLTIDGGRTWQQLRPN
jgi:photosystem II stability/assembly factor-like uncharacterized protein